MVSFFRGNARLLATLFITAAICLVTMLFFTRLVAAVLPFLLAFILANLMEPVVSFLNKKCRLPRAFASAVSVFTMVFLLMWLIYLVIGRLTYEAAKILEQREAIILAAHYFVIYLQNYAEMLLGADLYAIAGANLSLAEVGSQVSRFLTDNITPALMNLVNVAKNFPAAVVYTVVLVMSTFFFSCDRQKVHSFLRGLIPKKARAHFTSIKSEMTFALIAYIRAQITLMCITFCELLVGFLILGGSFANYAVLLALGIAIMDALPILGTGTALIPWSIYSLATGDVRVGLFLRALYGICLTVRQFIEPRLVGKQIGLHPLATLMTMYGGYVLFGFFGMLLGPTTVLVIRNLYADGFFTALLKTLSKGEERDDI